MLNDKVKIVCQKSLTQALQAKSELASLCHAKLYEFYFTKGETMFHSTFRLCLVALFSAFCLMVTQI